MANPDVTQSSATNFESVHDSDLDNLLDMKIDQLDALAGSLSGDGFEPFSNMADYLQSNLLWLAADMASAIKSIRDEMNHRHYKKVVAVDLA